MGRARGEARWVCLAVLVVCLAVFARSLANGPVWDDKPLVLDNPYLRTGNGLAKLFTSDLWSASGQAEPSSFYRPVTMLTFWINAMVAGTSAAAFRAGNVVIHACNAILLMVLLRRMTALGWLSAGALALAWAIAPISSEPVMWISGRFDLLVVTFALLAALAGRIRTPWGRVLTWLAVGCGLLSKESFIVWVPVVLLDDALIADAGASGAAYPRTKRWTKYAGIALLVAAYFLVRRELGLPSAAVAIHTGWGAVARSFFFLVSTFLRVLAWPTNLDPFRPYAPLSSVQLAASVALLVPAGAIVLWFLRRRDRASGSALLGLAWFALGTLPSALVGPNLDIVGDRYAYMPLVGLVLIAASVVDGVASRSFATPSRRAVYAVWACVLLLLAVEGWGTIRRARDWRDDTALARSSLVSTPGNAYALCSLGTIAAQQGDFASAEALLGRALEGNPDSWRTWNATCFVRLHQGRLEEAEQACREGLLRNPENPRGWVNLASVYVQARRWREASLAAERALALKSSYGEARYLAAASAANLGNMEQARIHLERGIEAEPGNARLRDLERQFHAPQR